jgi:hypothetical protein
MEQEITSEIDNAVSPCSVTRRHQLASDYPVFTALTHSEEPANIAYFYGSWL